MNAACDPLNLDSHDWQTFGKSLLKCSRAGCGIVVTKMLFDPDRPRARLGV